MKRDSIPSLSKIGQANLSQYKLYLCDLIDVSPSTIRNYLSDLCQFMAWYEQTSSAGQEIPQSFVPNTIATPTITGYRAYLQNSLKLKPASVNRYLITLKCYFTWVVKIGLIGNNPAAAVKLIPRVYSPPRHLSNIEESGLVAGVTNSGHKRDRTIIVLMLHSRCTAAWCAYTIWLADRSASAVLTNCAERTSAQFVAGERCELCFI